MIILAYVVVRGAALTIGEMEGLTGLDNDTVRKAVKGLSAKNRLFKQIGEHGRTTWLPAGDTFFRLLQDESQISQSPRFSDSGPTTTTTDLNNNLIDSVVVVVDSAQSPKTSDSGAAILYLTHGVTFEKNLAACRSAGIGEPMASKISRLEHVTPELIKAHVDSLVQGEKIGLAILRIQGDEMPRTWLEQIKSIPSPDQRANADEEFFDDDDEKESFCLWQDELDEVFSSSHPLAGEHKKGPKCGKLVTNNSIKWCDEHLQIGIDIYGG